MPSTYSSSLRLELIGDGEQAGSWGQTTNRNFGTLLEEAIAGVVTITHNNAASYNLTVASGATDEARNLVLNVTGTLTADRNVVAPSVEKTYIVRNNTSGGFNVLIKTASGAAVTVPNGRTLLVYCDGTDFRQATDFIGGTVPNATTFSNTVAVTGVATFSSGINVTGTSTFSSGTTFSSGINVTGTSTLNGNAALSGNVVFSGNARRITGDFTNATRANRVLAQTSTTNGSSTFGVVPNGTGVTSSFTAYEVADPDNSGSVFITASNTAAVLGTGKAGTGTTRPLSFTIDGVSALGIDVNRAVTIHTPVSGDHLSLAGASATLRLATTGSVASDGTITYLRGTGLSFQNSAGNVTYGSFAATGNLTINAPSSGAAVVLPAAAAGYSPLRVPHGSDPSSLSNGDLWTTTSGVKARINGATVQLGNELYLNRLRLEDDFYGSSPSTTFNAVTGVGWLHKGTASATLSWTANIAGHPGVLRINTPSTTSSTSYVDRGVPLLIEEIDYFVIVFRTGETTSIVVKMGYLTGADLLNGGTAGGAGVWFEYAPAINGNIRFLCESASTATTSTGPTLVANTWYQLEARRSGSTWTPTINGTAYTTISTNVPTGVLGLVMGCGTTTSANKSIELDYFGLLGTPIASRY